MPPCSPDTGGGDVDDFAETDEEMSLWRLGSDGEVEGVHNKVFYSCSWQDGKESLVAFTQTYTHTHTEVVWEITQPFQMLPFQSKKHTSALTALSIVLVFDQ